jgi:signal transduction histidine kinase
LEYLGAVRDITELRLSEQALSKVRSELTHMARISSLGALTASIAHEVNQPLSGVITNAETCLKMLAHEPPNLSGAGETVRRIVRDGNRAVDIVMRLRALFSKRTTANELVDLNGAASDVVALSRSDLQRNGIAVRMDLADGLPPVTGDRVQLQQVILNLLLNAVEAVRALDSQPRQVVIRTECEAADRVRVAVQDTGIGIERDSAERLFEAFYTTKAEGMGIGLSISRTIVDNHGGRIWAEPNLGPGATFAFSIPCRSRTALGEWNGARDGV